MTSTPCIITVAITGSVPTKKDNPAVPITVPEQVESTQAAFEAGDSAGWLRAGCSAIRDCWRFTAA